MLLLLPPLLRVLWLMLLLLLLLPLSSLPSWSSLLLSLLSQDKMS